MAPWWRGPGLLLRRFGVALALLAAAVVATLPAASAVPFLSSARSATLHHQLSVSCSWFAGVTLTSPLGLPHGAGGTVDYAGGLARRTEQASEAAAGIPLLGPGETTLISRVSGPINAEGSFGYPMFLVSRENFQEHIEVIAGDPDSGAWVPDAYAAFLGLEAGDDMMFFTNSGSTTLHNVGIYRSLRNQPDIPWWCDLLDVIKMPEGTGSAPQTVFVDAQTFLTMPEFDLGHTTHRITFPLTDPELNYDQAQAVVAALDAARDGLIQAHEDNAQPGVSNNPAVSSRMPAFAGRAELVRGSLLHQVVPIAAAGVLVGLVVVGAAAAYWVRRRRHELVMLAARGVGAGALAIKAVTEALPALVAGAAIGWGGAWALVRWAGPDPVVSAEATAGALVGAGLTLLLAVLTVGLVAGLACRSLADQVRARHRSVLRLLPLEVLVLAAAPLVWQWLGDEQIAKSEEDLTLGAVVHLPTRLLVVPIMVVTGLTVLLARLTVLTLRRAGRAWTPQGTASFLGWRRAGRQALMIAILASATSLPVALAAYGSVVTESVRTTISDEGRKLVGSDVVVVIERSYQGEVVIPESLAGEATIVRRMDGLVVGNASSDLLVIDPETFADAAYWNSSFGADSIEDVIAPLRNAEGSSGPPPALGTGRVQSGAQPVIVGRREVLPLEVTRIRALPAERGGYSLTIVPDWGSDVLTRYGHMEIWARGDLQQIVEAVAATGVPIRTVLDAAQIYGNTLWEPLIFTFDYLTALSLLTGVVTLVGLLLYLESQAPQWRRSYVLLRRMGISKGGHRRALIGELVLPLLAGLIGGLGITTGLVWFLHGSFDMNPDRPPDTVIDMPYPALGGIVAMTIVVAFAAVSYAQARVARAQPSEVLRDVD